MEQVFNKAKPIGIRIYSSKVPLLICFQASELENTNYCLQASHHLGKCNRSSLKKKKNITWSILEHDTGEGVNREKAAQGGDVMRHAAFNHFKVEVIQQNS